MIFVPSSPFTTASLPLLLILLSSFVANNSVDCKLIFSVPSSTELDNDNSNTVSYDVYNALMWRPDFNYTNIPVVDLHQSLEIFDYCDTDKYTIEGIAPLLLANNMFSNSTTTSNTTAVKNWIGILNEDILVSCVGSDYVWMQTSYELYSLLEVNLKPMGMSLLIEISTEQRVILNELSLQRAYFIKNIETGLLEDGSYATGIDMIRLSTTDDADIISSLMFTVNTAVKNNNLPFKLTSISPDPNNSELFYIRNHIWIYTFIIVMLEILAVTTLSIGCYTYYFIWRKSRGKAGAGSMLMQRQVSYAIQ